ncbi:tbc1 domain family member whacked [Anaeramoeba flamelloides]|uniref:Tbc1 domain family member whacked n=1 Tax=Anaeramoeba flamelloides TaxID=1746091 RepID=A0ABQ8ZEZ8_9EUKA|nr:tbc1 domain family member whacked [Anaeramoeba flamelloides]
MLDSNTKPVPAYELSCVHSGFMFKKGKIVKNWKLRFFVLENETLSYYLTQNEIEPKGVITLKEITPKLEPKKPEFLFLQGISRLWQFRAQNVEERDKWYKAIHKVKKFQISRKSVKRRLIDVKELKEQTNNKAEKEWLKIIDTPVKVVKQKLDKLRDLAKKGIPPTLRGIVYVHFTGAFLLKEKNSELYSLLKQWPNKKTASIELDVNRTFPTIEYFHQEGCEELRNVLIAFSIHNERVGYVQGIPFLTAMLLLHLSPEDCFWVLTQLMEDFGVEKIYSSVMSGLRELMFVFKQLLEKYLPELNDHLDSLYFNPDMITITWFGSLFLSSSSLSFSSRILDLLIIEGGTDILLPISLAIFERSLQTLLSYERLDEIMQHFQLLKSANKENTKNDSKFACFNIDNIITIAYKYFEKIDFWKFVESSKKIFQEENKQELIFENLEEFPYSSFLLGGIVTKMNNKNK